MNKRTNVERTNEQITKKQDNSGNQLICVYSITARLLTTLISKNSGKLLLTLETLITWFCLLKRLYANSTVVVILDHKLFLQHYIIWNVLEGWKGSINITSRRVNNLRYADDTTLIAINEQETY